MRKLGPDILFVDVETTGPNPFIHEMLSVALVPFDEDQASLSVYIRHDAMNWTDYGRRNFLNFESEWLTRSVDPRNAACSISDYLAAIGGGKVFTLVGHNVGFDMSFLRKLAAASGTFDLPLISHRTIDTHTLLYALLLQGRVPAAALTSDGAFDYFGITIPSSDRHTALGDAKATRLLFLRLMDELTDPSISRKGALAR